MSNSIYDIEVQTIDGKPVTLSQYQGKVMLIVNVATLCGYTPQYQGLEWLYEKYQDQRFVVLGFPCNQFGEQEPGTEKEIKNFCETKYHITFPLFAKLDVNGKHAHPLYQYLKSKKPGLLGTKAIKWNFTKFLISREGQVITRFSPQKKPEDISTAIEQALFA